MNQLYKWVLPHRSQWSTANGLSTIVWFLPYGETQKLAADLEEWLLFTILSRLHTTLTLFHGYNLRWSWFSFSLKVLLIPLRRVGPRGESISASNSTWDRYLNPARYWVPMAAVQTVSIPLVAQHFSKVDKNCYGDLNPHGPASWVQKKKKKGLMQKCWLLGTKYL